MVQNRKLPVTHFEIDRDFKINLLNVKEREIFQSYELIFYLPIQISRLGYVTKEIPVTRAYPINENTPTKIKGIRIKIKLIKILISAGMGKYNP